MFDPNSFKRECVLSPDVIIGLGNEIAGDDGVGIWVARKLAHLLKNRGEVAVVALPWAGFALLDALSGRRRAVIIDCLCTGCYAPGTIVRLVVALFRAGAIETLLRSRTIWVCASCYNCTVRCPADIKVTDLLYALKRIAIDRQIFPRKFPVYALCAEPQKRQAGAFQRTRTNPGNCEMKCTYYPGYSLHATGVAYDKSLRAVFDKLGQELAELDDWNCCGATAYMSVKETVAFTISARNLALAQREGHDVVAPCSACFTVLNKTRKFLSELPELRHNVNAALAEGDLRYDAAALPIRHPLEVLINDIGINRIVAAQKKSLEAFKPACYYGCQIVRPERAVLEDPEVPMAMDILFEELGAHSVDYPPKVRCCGGMLVATYEDVALKLCHELLDWAEIAGANCIAVTCPMCQSNLDLLTKRINAEMGTAYNFPVLYFTQLLGLTLGGTAKEVGLEHGVVPCDIIVTELPLTRADNGTNGRLPAVAA